MRTSPGFQITGKIMLEMIPCIGVATLCTRTVFLAMGPSPSNLIVPIRHMITIYFSMMTMNGMSKEN